MINLQQMPSEEKEELILGQKAFKHQTQNLQLVAKKLEQSISQVELAVNKISKVIEKQNDVIMDTTSKITEEYLNSYKEEFKDRMRGDKTN